MENGFIDLNDFIKLEMIGSGQFGEVYKVKEKKTGSIYACKISKASIDGQSASKMRDLLREINIMYKLFHPTIERFIGFSPCNFIKEPKPVIITEFFPNGTLGEIIKNERKGFANSYWDDTRKLITIYGIASAMAFLHANKIIHRDLKPENILMDEHLIPKIADFGLSKVQHTKESMTLQSTVGVKGTPIYIAPEIWQDFKYTTACDVYSFGMIVYEIITNDEPYPNVQSIFKIMTLIQDGIKPAFKINPPSAYRNLIESCWDNDPEKRPSFDEILIELKENPDFITDLIDERDYYDFIDFIDESQATFDSSKQIIQIDQFIKSESNTFKKITINSDQSIKKSKSFFKRGSIKMKFIYPSEDYISLSDECQQLVQKAETDPVLQSYIGKCLIEGREYFPQNTEIGIKYLKNSISKGCINAVIYYSKILIKGDLIPKDLEKAKKYLKKYIKENNGDVFLLYGKIKKKTKNFVSALQYFEKASKVGNAEGMYECGKMLINCNEITKNEKEAIKYFEMSLKNGFLKSKKYLQKVDEEDPKNTSSSYRKKWNTFSEFHNTNSSTAGDVKRRSFKERKLTLNTSMEKPIMVNDGLKMQTQNSDADTDIQIVTSLNEHSTNEHHETNESLAKDANIIDPIMDKEEKPIIKEHKNSKRHKKEHRHKDEQIIKDRKKHKEEERTKEEEKYKEYDKPKKLEKPKEKEKVKKEQKNKKEHRHTGEKTHKNDEEPKNEKIPKEVEKYTEDEKPKKLEKEKSKEKLKEGQKQKEELKLKEEDQRHKEELKLMKDEMHKEQEKMILELEDQLKELITNQNKAKEEQIKALEQQKIVLEQQKIAAEEKYEALRAQNIAFEKQKKEDDEKLADQKRKLDKRRKEEKQKILVNSSKIVVSIENNKYEDIFDVFFKKNKDFCIFWNYGENGSNILKHEANYSWESTSNDGYHEFDISFTHHTIRLTSFAICTSQYSKYDSRKPLEFKLFGYNGRTNKWKIVYNCPYTGVLEKNTRYFYELDNDSNNEFYQIFAFLSLSCPFSLSYIQFYGDVKEDGIDIPKSVKEFAFPKVNFDTPPIIEAVDDPKVYCKGIFEKAIDLYGQTLHNFVEIYDYHDPDTFYFDVWGARNCFYKSIKYAGPTSISIYFIKHDFYITGYQIKPHNSPGITSWCVIGCKSPDDSGVILDHRYNNNMNNNNSYYSYKISESNNGPFRIIQFVGLNSQYSFQTLDLFGTAKPGVSNPFSDKQLCSSYNYPSDVNSMFVG